MGFFTRLVRYREHERMIRHDAIELRRRYGAEAEQWCEAGMYSAASPATRRMLKDIHRALAHIPPERLH
jgi:hypothetical protein